MLPAAGIEREGITGGSTLPSTPPQVETFDESSFPQRAFEDITIGRNMLFETSFSGLQHGPGGHAWILARKACEQIPIDWSSARRDLTSGEFDASGWVVKLTTQVRGDRRRREHVLIRADRVGDRMASIDPNRVDNEPAREKLRYCQQHVAEADDAWPGSQAQQPPPPPADDGSTSMRSPTSTPAIAADPFEAPADLGVPTSTGAVRADAARDDLRSARVGPRSGQGVVPGRVRPDDLEALTARSRSPKQA